MLSSGFGISSVAHKLSCFGVGFSLCLITVGLFLCLAPFLWGKVSDPSAGPLLSVCCDGLLVVFQFYSVIWLWMLLTASGDEHCGALPALFQAAAFHQPIVSPPAFPAFVYWSLHGDQFLAPSPSLVCFQQPRPLCCVLVFSSLFIHYFSGGEGVSMPWGLCWFIPGWLGEYNMTLGAHLFGLQNVSQAVLELASGHGKSSPVFSV
jgi:hypothetical protein